MEQLNRSAQYTTFRPKSERLSAAYITFKLHFKLTTIGLPSSLSVLFVLFYML